MTAPAVATPARRLPWLVPGGLALLTGVLMGLSRLGWPVPFALPAGSHGALMVGGFLGTLIGMERAVALGGALPRIGPLLTGLSALLLLAGHDCNGARGAMVLGAVALTAVNLRLVRLRPTDDTWIMALGSLLWLGGNLLWAFRRPVPEAVPWWIGFLVLTVAGERLELSRLRRLPRWASPLLRAALALFVTGLLVGLGEPRAGWTVAGIALAATGSWFLAFDLARRTIRMPGLTGFAATGVLAGHAWLAVGGALMAWLGPQAAGGPYDAVLHAFFLGFAFSMIMAHAPLIAPGVLGLAIPFRSCAYGPLVLLQVSLALRLAGDLAGWAPGRSWGGLLNAVALGLFLLHTASSARARSRVPDARAGVA